MPQSRTVKAGDRLRITCPITLQDGRKVKWNSELGFTVTPTFPAGQSTTIMNYDFLTDPAGDYGIDVFPAAFGTVTFDLHVYQSTGFGSGVTTWFRDQVTLSIQANAPMPSAAVITDLPE